MTVIEQGIPIPNARELAAKIRAVLAQMKVDDSALFTPEVYVSKNLYVAIRVNIHRYSSANGKDFVSRREGDGFRVWRTK